MGRAGRGLWLAVALAAACGGRRADVLPSPETLLTEARREFRGGEFRKALLKFQRLSFELAPGDPRLAEARYSLGECYFQTGDRVQAAQQFRDVAEQFPDGPYAPLALLRAGDAHVRLWRHPDLDPTHGQTALALYQELAGRYPGSEAAARAQLHVRRLKEWFAEKTYKTGVFYFKRYRAYDSAIIYFKDVIASYPDTRRAPDALVRLVEIYRALRYDDERRETCEHLRRFYPRADGLAEACPPAPDRGGPGPADAATRP